MIAVQVNGGCWLKMIKTKLEVETQKPPAAVAVRVPSEPIVQVDKVAGGESLNWKAMYGWLKSANTKSRPDRRKPSVSK